MQVKKYEAQTIQEALDAIKRDLGPEAIILQTKKNRKGFGLMSGGSVEITVAVSDRSVQKKKFAEARIPDNQREQLLSASAGQQADVFNRMADKQLERMAASTQDRVQLGGSRAQAQAQASAPTKKSAPEAQKKSITATRYADIVDVDGKQTVSTKGQQAREALNASLAQEAEKQAQKPRLNDMSMEQELQHLKRMMDELKSNQEEIQIGTGGSGVQALAARPTLATPALASAYDQLVVNGIDKYYAMNLIKQAQFALGEKACESPDAVLDQVALEVMENANVDSLLTGLREAAEAGTKTEPTVIALVGPTGVGKTTTIAKIASVAHRNHQLKVGLINIDSYKTAAFDQIATYAKILNVPFRSVAQAEDLNLALRDFKNLDLVLIDTTGRSQKETDSLREMETLVHSVPNIRTFLSLAVSTRDAELYEMGRRFGIFRPEGLILSKLDEALSYGAIYNVSQRLKLPLMFFTTGQKVPDDLEEATKERLAALVLDLHFDDEDEKV